MDVKMATEENSWRTGAFRQSVVSKIEEAIQRSGMPTTKNSVEMENHVFLKAKSKEEYLGFVARLILHVREMNSKKGGGMGGPGGGGGQAMAPDPINALQTLARQGNHTNILDIEAFMNYQRPPPSYLPRGVVVKEEIMEESFETCAAPSTSTASAAHMMTAGSVTFPWLQNGNRRRSWTPYDDREARSTPIGELKRQLLMKKYEKEQQLLDIQIENALLKQKILKKQLEKV